MFRRLSMLAAGAAFLAGLAAEAPAQQEIVVGPVNKAELNAGRVTIMTGGIDGLHESYLKLAGDMASVMMVTRPAFSSALLTEPTTISCCAGASAARPARKATPAASIASRRIILSP